MKLECLVFAYMIVAGPITAMALSCSDVNSNLEACTGYLTNGGISTPGSQCCNGVRNLNGMALTPLNRREACRCIKYAARTLGPRFNADRAAGIPGRCGVKIPYNIQIGFTTNCKTYVNLSLPRIYMYIIK